jgi:hypothetical protein
MDELSETCGQRRNGWETPGPGRHRLPCVLPTGHEGDHKDAFAAEWTHTPTSARLLPWNSADGKPAYLVTDPSGASPLARLADSAEAQQLDTAHEVLRLSGMPEMDSAGAGELRWVCERLREALTDTLRVCESRGMRLPAPEPVE